MKISYAVCCTIYRVYSFQNHAAISPYTTEISGTNPRKTNEIGCFILFFILFLLENQGKTVLLQKRASVKRIFSPQDSEAGDSETVSILFYSARNQHFKITKAMAKVYEFISNGTEEVEALIPVDVLRRADVDVCIVSTTGNLEVTTAHNVRIIADALIEDIADFSDADLLMIPGGLPGAENLCNHPLVREAIQKQYNAGKLVSAICAGPMIFGSLGISKGKRCTCYPGFEDYLDGATYTGELVTVDGNVVTGEGPAATFPYAYTLCEMLCGKTVSKSLQDGMMYTHLISEAKK